MKALSKSFRLSPLKSSTSNALSNNNYLKSRDEVVRFLLLVMGKWSIGFSECFGAYAPPSSMLWSNKNVSLITHSWGVGCRAGEFTPISWFFERNHVETYQYLQGSWLLGYCISCFSFLLVRPPSLVPQVDRKSVPTVSYIVGFSFSFPPLRFFLKVRGKE